VAEFISNVNLLDGTCVGHDGQDLRISVAGVGDLRVITSDAALSPGAKATLAIRPEKLRFAAATDAGANRLPGTLRAVTYAGDRNHAIVDVPGLERPLLVTTPNRDRHLSEPVTPGAAVIVTWDSTAAALLTD
jgi:spermidine/putrescine transport system ATP-binding protein